MQTIRNHTRSVIAGLTAMFTLAIVGVANAAPSATTGIDYTADLVSPVKSELTLAIVAGLALVVLLMAVRAGLRFIKSFGKG
jgi:hypothetical protein